jgi:hypothetical protein
MLYMLPSFSHSRRKLIAEQVRDSIHLSRSTASPADRVPPTGKAVVCWILNTLSSI